MKQPKLIVRVLTPDYIKIQGIVFTDDRAYNVNQVFAGVQAKAQARSYIDDFRIKINEGLMEAQIIVNGELSDNKPPRCNLTNALYGTA